MKRGHKIRPVSKKKRAGNVKYFKAKTEYQALYPHCASLGCGRSLLKGDLIDLHHRGGKNGPLYWCKKYFMSLCREHHNWVKDHQDQARANGWLVDVSSDEVHELKRQELFNT